MASMSDVGLGDRLELLLLDGLLVVLEDEVGLDLLADVAAEALLDEARYRRVPLAETRDNRVALQLADGRLEGGA